MCVMEKISNRVKAERQPITTYEVRTSFVLRCAEIFVA